MTVFLSFFFHIFLFFLHFAGLTHHHRSFVVTQKELDAVPKVKVESSHKLQDDILTTESRCKKTHFTVSMA